MTTALYRRYRPDTFEDVIGQDHVTVPLRTALAKNRVNHAYLFSGPRGCGKTTSARILARCLNCEQGPTPTPCGVCPSCRDLATGGAGSLDVIEIDAASHGGVDDARDLRERATFAPARDRYKIFIIDEAHMVTSAGFNALLKIVEEPPEHIKFIFATTEPEKVIGTIRSRTHHYPFRLIAPEPMLAYVEHLCAAENIPVSPGVLPLVIRAGGGSGRDTLSVLDQLMAGAGPDGISYDLAVSLLGYTHAELLDDVVDALGARDAATVFGAVDRVIQSGLDPRRFVEDLLERFRDLIVVRALGADAAQVLHGVPQDQLERMGAQATNLGGSELSRWGDVTNQALTEMTGATSPRLHLELLCARLLLPSADDTERGLAARVDRLERNLNFSGTPVEAGGSATSVPDAAGSGSAASAGTAGTGAGGIGAGAGGAGAPAEWAGESGAAAARRALRNAQGGQDAGAAQAPASPEGGASPAVAAPAAPRTDVQGAPAASAEPVPAPAATPATPGHAAAPAPVAPEPVAPERAAAPRPPAPQPGSAHAAWGLSENERPAPSAESAPGCDAAADSLAAGVSDFQPTPEELAEALDDGDDEFDPIEYPEDATGDDAPAASLPVDASAPSEGSGETFAPVTERPAAPVPQATTPVPQAPTQVPAPSPRSGGFDPAAPLSQADPAAVNRPMDTSPIGGGEDHVAKARAAMMAAAARQQAAPAPAPAPADDASSTPAPSPRQTIEPNPAPVPSAPAAPAQHPATSQQSPESAASAQQPAEPNPAPAQSAPPHAAPPAGEVPHPAGGQGSVEMFRRAWPQIMDHLKDSRKFVWSMVQPHVSLAGFDGRTLVLAFANPGPMTAFRSRPEALELVRASIREVLGVNPEIDVTSGGAGPGSMAGGDGAPKADGRPAPAGPAVTPPTPPAATAPVVPAAGAAPTADETPAAPVPALAPSTPEPPVATAPSAPFPEPAAAAAPAREAVVDREPSASEAPTAEEPARPVPRASASPAPDAHPASPRPSIDPRLLTDLEEPWDPEYDSAVPVDDAWALAPSRAARPAATPQPTASAPRTAAPEDHPAAPAATASAPPERPAAPAPSGTQPTPQAERPAAPAPASSGTGNTPAAPVPGERPAAPPPGLGWGQAPTAEWGTPAPGAPIEAPAPASEPRQGRKSKYQELMARAQRGGTPDGWGANAAASRQAPPVESDPADFVPSDDDEELENSTTFGRAALERLLDATLIQELDLSGQPIERRGR